MRAVLANVRTAWTVRGRALVVRFQRTTPRERLLLGALALGIFLYAPILAMDRRAEASERYVDAVTERAAARLTLNAARRAAADPLDRAVFEDMRGWGVEASNPATAQVLLERRLFEAVNRAQLVNAQITTRPEIETLGATQWVEGEVQADLRWTPVFAFLDAVAAWPEGFRITSFQYETTPPPAANAGIPPEVLAAVMATQPLGRVRIGVAVPARIVGTAATEGGA